MTEPLHEWMQRISHREFETRLADLEEEWNRPSRSDHYLMLLAYEIQHVLAKKPPSLNFSHYRIKFGSSMPSAITPEEKGRRNKSYLVASLGGRDRIKVVKRTSTSE